VLYNKYKILIIYVLQLQSVKNDPKYIFEKIHNQPVFNTLCIARFKTVIL